MAIFSRWMALVCLSVFGPALVAGHASELVRPPAIDFRRFYPNDVAPRGTQFPGAPLTVNSKRTLVELTAVEKRAIGYGEQDLVFANYRRGDQHYFIYFPGVRVGRKNADRSISFLDVESGGRDHIRDISFVKERWSEGARPLSSSIEIHTLLLVRFNERYFPRLVLSQEAMERNPSDARVFARGQGDAVPELILSTEAVRLEGREDTPFFKGAFQHQFAVTHLVYDYGTRQATTRAEGGTYEVVPLDFSRVNVRADSPIFRVTRAPRMALFLQALNMNQVLERQRIYDLFMTNCTTDVFKLFQDIWVMGPLDTREINRNVERFVRQDLPNLVRFAEQMGLERLKTTYPDAVQALAMIGVSLAQDRLTGKIASFVQAHSFSEQEIRYLSGWPPFSEGLLRSMRLLPPGAPPMR